jgi:hypothetical protein
MSGDRPSAVEDCRGSGACYRIPSGVYTRASNRDFRWIGIGRMFA